MVLLKTQLDRFLLSVNKMRKNSLQREAAERERATYCSEKWRVCQICNSSQSRITIWQTLWPAKPFSLSSLFFLLQPLHRSLMSCSIDFYCLSSSLKIKKHIFVKWKSASICCSPLYSIAALWANFFPIVQFRKATFHVYNGKGTKWVMVPLDVALPIFQFLGNRVLLYDVCTAM